jgi:dihydrofolate reductase
MGGSLFVGFVLFWEDPLSDLRSNYFPMRKIIVFEWMSLDGIYDAGLMDRWWNPYDSPGRQAVIRQIINDCDAMLYGRKTYELLRPYWSSLRNNEMGVAGALNSVKKYVISRTLRQAEWENSEIISEDMAGAVAALKRSAGGKILVIGSSMLVAGLMNARLVDEWELLVQPYIVGTGEHLFAQDMRGPLELCASRLLDKGVLHLSYRAG